MPTIAIVLIAVVGVVVLGALAWWSSGRTKGRAPGSNPDGDIKHASGYLYHQNRSGDPTGGIGGGPGSL